MAPEAEAWNDEFVRLRLDAANVIVAVNSAFDRFAVDNDAAHINAATVTGRSLLEFVSGDETRTVVELTLRTARMLEHDIVRQYRCDSAATRRLMEMRLVPRADGGLDMIHRLLWAEPLRRLVPFTAVERAANGIRRCSMCNRLYLDGRWHEPDQAPVGLGGLKVTYCVCADCRAAYS